MTGDLSNAARAVMEKLRELETEQPGWPVMFGPLLARTGFASRSTLADHLRVLEQRGLVERSPYYHGGCRSTIEGRR